MSTFLIIIVILAFLAAYLNRTKGTIEITSKNEHLIKKDKNDYLTKSELKLEIIKENDNDFRPLVLINLCKKYFNRFGWDKDVIVIIIAAYLAEENFDDAYRFASILCRDDLSYKWGFYFKGLISWHKGEILEGNRFFQISVTHWGMDLNYINKLKKDIINDVKPKNDFDRIALENDKLKLHIF